MHVRMKQYAVKLFYNIKLHYVQATTQHLSSVAKTTG